MNEYSKTMKLSILTPTIPGREKQLAELQNKIARQSVSGQVEHLALCDNRARSIGGKRQALVDIARGDYIAFVDDDDDIADNYVAEILAAIEANVDVVTFEQDATYNDQKSRVIFKLGQGDGPFTPDGVTQRDAWHVCAWKRATVAPCRFLECNYGEDRAWAVQARQRARTTVHIPKVLHYYRHDSATTAAPES